jgi:hypothetical protein
MTTVPLTQPNPPGTLTHLPKQRNGSSFMKCWDGFGIQDKGKSPEMKYSNPNSAQFPIK